MTDQIKEAFLEYEELKLQEKSIKEKLDKLKPTLLEAIPPEGIEGKHGSFIIRAVNSWKYSDAVKSLVDSVETLQKEEKAKGIAEKITSDSLVYKAYDNKE